MPDEKDDYDTLAERCEDEYGRCVKDDEETYHSSSESCTNDGGNWVPAQWVPKPDYVTEKTCTALGTGSFCRTCSIGRANSPTQCSSEGICSGPQGCSDLSSEHDCTQNTNCTFTNGAAVNAEGDFSSEDACRNDGARCEQCSHSEGSSYHDCLNRGTCSVDGKSSRDSCEGNGDCFKASDGSLKESDVSEFDCNRGACFNSTGHVVNSDADSSSDCDIASGGNVQGEQLDELHMDTSHCHRC